MTQKAGDLSYPCQRAQTVRHEKAKKKKFGTKKKHRKKTYVRKIRPIPGICLKSARWQNNVKGLPRATHCADCAQTSTTVTAGSELCPLPLEFRIKVGARRCMSENRGQNDNYTHLASAVTAITTSSGLIWQPLSVRQVVRSTQFLETAAVSSGCDFATNSACMPLRNLPAAAQIARASSVLLSYSSHQMPIPNLSSLCPVKSPN